MSVDLRRQLVTRVFKNLTLRTGPRGAIGPQGEEGPAGADGATGPTGPTGPAGPAQIYVDEGIPSSGLGSNGDLYIESVSGDLYSKMAGVWVLGLSLIGPAGADGDQGVQGEDGPAGADGDSFVTVGPSAAAPTVTKTFMVGDQNTDVGFVHRVAVVAYTLAPDNTKVFSPNVGYGTYTDTGSGHDDPFGIRWAWGAVAGAVGYRVFKAIDYGAGPDNGIWYDAYEDTAATFFEDLAPNRGSFPNSTFNITYGTLPSIWIASSGALALSAVPETFVVYESQELTSGLKLSSQGAGFPKSLQLLAATSISGGYMSAADKIKIDALAGGGVLVIADTVDPLTLSGYIALNDTAMLQSIYCKSDSGANVTAAVHAGYIMGQRVRWHGCSDTATLTFDPIGDGVTTADFWLNGPIVLRNGSMIEGEWDGVRWREIGRNNLGVV